MDHKDSTAIAWKDSPLRLDLQNLEGGRNKEDLSCRYAYGRRILEEKNLQPYGGIMRVYRHAARDIGMSLQEVIFRVKFAQKYPRYSDFQSQFSNDIRKVPSWYKVVSDYLYEKRNDAVDLSLPLPPYGKYRTITADPPWPMEKIQRAVRFGQGTQLDYPIMTLDQIAALPIKKLAAADGCHVYLWTTEHFLPDAFEVFDKWDVKYECTHVWKKNVGVTPFSWMYNAEFILFGRFGSLEVLEKGIPVCFEAKVREHSRKPDIFYEHVRRASPEPRLEMFAREHRFGFRACGLEVDHFEEAVAKNAR